MMFRFLADARASGEVSSKLLNPTSFAVAELSVSSSAELSSGSRNAGDGLPAFLGQLLDVWIIDEARFWPRRR
jgi:hypothetical protein